MADDPATFSDTLRQVSAAVSLDLQVRDISTTEILVKREQGVFRMIGVTVGLVMLSVILLSAAGIYSLMSFTVARRRREIGIRAALGADRRRLLLGIFSRTLGQLATGAAVGMLGAIGFEQLLDGEMFQGRGADDPAAGRARDGGRRRAGRVGSGTPGASHTADGSPARGVGHTAVERAL